jgi:hypothetical protein
MEIRKEFRNKVRTDFMVGKEIEKTPAFSKTTLLVQGYKTLDEIYKKAIDNKVEHIYLGANRSFRPGHDWGILIGELLNYGFMVTLDYLVNHHNELAISLPINVWKHKCFVPIVTVDITNLCGLSENLTVKVDDLGFVSEGIWCINCKYIANSEQFTGWDEYAEDKIV